MQRKEFVFAINSFVRMESDHVSVRWSFGPDDCHKLIYCRKSGLLKLDEFSEDIQEVLKLRSGCFSLEGCKTICNHHKNLSDKFAALQNTCSDPFNIHTKPVKTTVKELTLDSVRKYDSRLLLSATLIPGKKICKRCEMKLNPRTDEFDDDQGEYSQDDSSFLECSIETVDQSLTSLDCTPLKKVRSDRAIKYGKRKVSEASRQLAKSISDALEQPSLSSVDSCADCEQLMYQLKEKLNISDRRQKVQILTLMPD